MNIAMTIEKMQHVLCACSLLGSVSVGDITVRGVGGGSMESEGRTARLGDSSVVR